MDNDNKQNGVITPSQQNSTPTTTTEGTTSSTPEVLDPQNVVNDQVITPPVAKKKANNKIIILALLVLVIFGIGYYTLGNKNTPVLKNNTNNQNGKNKEKELIKVDTGTKYGDEYALQIQSFFDTFDAVDVAFIDLDFNDTPEMIVKFTEDKKESLQIFYLNDKTDVVTSSKAFPNSEIELIYSLYEGVSRFYLHIKNTEKYGTYTEASKILAGTVYKTDVDATNENQVNEFKSHYVVSDYDITYYEVKKASFEENFKTMFERNERYASEISEARDKLDEDNKDLVEKKVDDNDSLKVAEFKLVYGKYIPEEALITDGSIYENIYIYNDGTLKMNGKEYRYEVNSNFLMLDDGSRIRVFANDSLMLDEKGIVYRSENPINMTDVEKQQRQRDINDAEKRAAEKNR